MNSRWERNLPDIATIERAIERNKTKVSELLKDESIRLEVRESKALDLIELNDDLQNEINNMKKSFEELVEEARQDLLKLYLDEEDKRDWAIAWSGGKDSTTVMGLVVSMIELLPPEKRVRKVHAVMSDTKMENPNLESYMHEQVELLNKYAAAKDLPITARIVTRTLDNSYFYLVLGKGYFLPQNNGTGRWCTSRLKIRPQNAELRKIDPSYILIGTRLSESAKRKSSIKKWRNDDGLGLKIGEHAEINTAYTFMPIVDFTIEDVWEYLQKERLGWTSTHKVRTLYRDATGECGFTNPKKTEKKATVLESCGARFGCWSCPVILKDKSTEEMAKVHPWQTPLSEWRFLQLKVMGDYKPERPEGQRRKDRSKVLRLWEQIGSEIKLVTKSGYKMNEPKRMVDRKTGELRDDQGAVTVEARKYLFDRLLIAQYEMNILRTQQGLEPIELISEEEQRKIKDRWEEDAERRPWLLTNVNNIPISRLDELLDEGERKTAKINEGSEVGDN